MQEAIAEAKLALLLKPDRQAPYPTSKTPGKKNSLTSICRSAIA